MNLHTITRDIIRAFFSLSISNFHGAAALIFENNTFPYYCNWKQNLIIAQMYLIRKMKVSLFVALSFELFHLNNNLLFNFFVIT